MLPDYITPLWFVSEFLQGFGGPYATVTSAPCMSLTMPFWDKIELVDERGLEDPTPGSSVQRSTN